MSITDLLAADPFARALGVRIVDAAPPTRVTVATDATPGHRNAAGRIASGVLFGLADCALSLISNADRTSVAVATHLTRVAPVLDDVGVLAATIEPGTEAPGRAVTYRATLTADDLVVAHFTGTTLTVG